MNILFASWQEFNPFVGGVERVSFTLAQRLIENTHHVFFVSAKKANSIPYTPIAEQLFLPDSTSSPTKKNKQTLVDFILQKNIDIVICQSAMNERFSALCHYAQKETHVKLIYVLHTAPDYKIIRIRDTSKPVLSCEKTFSQNYKRITRTLFKRLKIYYKTQSIGNYYRKLYNAGDAFVLLSNSFIPIVQQFIDQSDTPKLHAIPNPRSFEEKTIDITKKEKRLLYVGRLDFPKAPDRVLIIWEKIFQQHPDWALDILGDGPYYQDLQKLSQEMKLERIHFHGFQKPDPFYSSDSIILLTSRYEGLPMVFIEAMEYGVIPLAFDSFAALQDIITDGENGYRIKPYDMDAFAKKLSLLMRDESLRERMSIQCQHSVEKFNMDNIISQWENLFHQLIK